MVKAKIPIIILHGWNLSGDRFSPLGHVLRKKGYTVFTPDLPGFKTTTPLTRPYRLEDYVEYVANYLKKKRISTCGLIGHSFGGRVAILLAVQYPSMIKYLVLTGTPAIGKGLTIKETVYLIVAKSGKIVFSIFPLNYFYRFARKILYKMAGTWDYYHASGMLRQTFKNIISYKLEPLLPQITLPTLVIWGKEDKIVEEAIGKEVAKHIPKAQWVSVEHVGHNLPYTRPEKFSYHVLRFINYNEYP